MSFEDQDQTKDLDAPIEETEMEEEQSSLIIEPDNALPEIGLDDLSELSREAVARAKWTKLMAVQAKTIPYILACRDLMIQSRTGSGKTGAFMLPILERVQSSRATCQALVLVPTRELAQQVASDAALLAGKTGVHTVAVYGGVGYKPQVDAFEKGAHVVIGTPGRVLDHLLRGNLTLKDLQILVFDEADRMMSMGFYPDMKEVQRYLPRRDINAYMFSATFPSHVMRLAGEFLRQPEFLSLSRDHIHVARAGHVFYLVPGMEKDRCLVRIIEMENPGSAIIFCNTKVNVHYVATVLWRFGYNADELSADLTQNARDRVLTRLRKGELRFLIATDVAARGIDISHLSHVILYEPPEDHESYIHRAGRTGRAGAGGEVLSLVTATEQSELKRIAKRYDIEMVERPMPSDEDVETIVAQRVTALLEASLRSRDKLQIERMQRFVPLANGLKGSEQELDLVAMLIDDYYQKSLHAPPPQPETPKPSPSSAERRPRPKSRPPRRDGGSRRKRS